MALSNTRLIALTLLVGCSGSIAPTDAPDVSAAGSGSFVADAGRSGATAGSSVTAAAAGSGAGGANSPAALGSTSLNLSGAPQYTRLVRLTNQQWAHSVSDNLKLPRSADLGAGFQSPVSGTTDFTNNELVLSVDQRAASDFQSAAEAVAASVTQSDSALARAYPGQDAAGFIATLGRRFYRRPLTSAEQAAYLALFDQGGSPSAGTPGSFAKGASLVLRALLQSPHFLYRTELGEPGTPLTGYELAAKLSLWLRDTTPSDALLDAAASGQLDTVQGAAGLASMMLSEPSATEMMRHFHGELYDFDRYANVSKVGVSDYDPALNDEYVETSYLYFDKLFREDLGVHELLTSTTGFVGRRMAALYGVPAPASGYEERELGPQRTGYFSQIPFLSLHGLNGDPDSIHRGVSMNLDVLCTVLGPPAPDLPPIPALQPGQTNRQRISKLTEGCGGVCHNQQINPLGFAFEHFDGMGRWRDVEGAQLPVTSQGVFMSSEGTIAFEGATDLMKALAAGQQSHRCYAKKLASFGLQRDIVAQDLPLLEQLTNTSMTQGSIKQVIVTLVGSESYRLRSGGGQ